VPKIKQINNKFKRRTERINHTQ